MNNDYIKKALYNPTPLKILSFLSIYPERIFSASEIMDEVRVSKGATNQTLHLLVALDIITREKKGNVFLYKINQANDLIKYFKIFDNLLEIQNLVKILKPYSYQIVLFGSCADGSNVAKSDIDLFIKTEHKEKVSRLINRYHARFTIRPVIQDPLDIAAAQKEDGPFYEQVKKGIVLWEGKPTHETI